MSRECQEREAGGQPVKTLQYMLRRLRGRWSWMPFVPLDGCFGETTLEAVMIFQREMGLAVTGVVDLETWNAIREQWVAFEADQAGPRPVHLYPRENGEVRPGEQRLFFAIPQAMLQILSVFLEGLRPCEGEGRNGEKSACNVCWLQRAAGAPETGVMDWRTWDTLSRLYEVFVVRSSDGPAILSWG